MKLAYFFTRRHFGKVLTPLQVYSARLPAASGMFYSKIGRLDKKLTLAPEPPLLVRAQVAQLNVCEFCMDISRSGAVTTGINPAKFAALEQYGANPLVTAAKRAALDYATELTRAKTMKPAPFACLADHYTERQDLRDRLARDQRARLQPDQHRPERPFRRALRTQPARLGAGSVTPVTMSSGAHSWPANNPDCRAVRNLAEYRHDRSTGNVRELTACLERHIKRLIAAASLLAARP